MLYCSKCKRRTKEYRKYCSKCGAKIVQTKKNTGPFWFQEERNKKRPAWMVFSVVCFLFAVVSLFAIPANWATALGCTFFFAVLGAMFLLLYKTPKNSAYLFGNKDGIKKGVFAGGSAVLSLVLLIAFSQGPANQELQGKVNQTTQKQNSITNTAAVNETTSTPVESVKNVWKITVNLTLLENDHVGEEWASSITYEGEEVYGSFEIAAEEGKEITITGNVVEEDDTPDQGSGSVTIELKNGNTQSETFLVQENRGRYAGNKAQWELVVSCELIEKTK